MFRLSGQVLLVIWLSVSLLGSMSFVLGEEAVDDSSMVRGETEHGFESEGWDSWHYSSLSEESGWFRRFWGKPFLNRLYLGMWSLHFSSEKHHQNNNQLLGINWKGFYGGTFINSHDGRVYSGGWQRAMYRNHWQEFTVEAGYRLGLMYCPERYYGVMDSRVFPLFQVVADVDFKQFGVQFSWAGVVATAGLFYRF